jgi:hypothetical protein
LNETLHHSPRFSEGIIASMGFSHSLDPYRKSPRPMNRRLLIKQNIGSQNILCDISRLALLSRFCLPAARFAIGDRPTTPH